MIDITDESQDELFDIGEQPENMSQGPYIPRGDVRLKLANVEKSTPSKNNPDIPILKWTFVIAEGHAKDRELYHWTTLHPNAAALVHAVVQALGMKPEANGRYAFLNPKHHGLQCVAHITDSKRNPKYSEISHFIME